MKKKMFLRLVAMLLVVSMLPVSAGAVTIDGLKSTRSSGTSWLGSFIQSLLDSFQSKDDTGEAETDQTTSEMEVVTDETTVQNADLLRASTYNLTTTSLTDDSTSTTVLKYFPVTLYDYDTDDINNATHQKEAEAGVGDTWNGIYFNNGDPTADSYTYTTPADTVNTHAAGSLSWETVDAGTYYVDSECETPADVNTEQVESIGYEIDYDVSVDDLIDENSDEWLPTQYYYKDYFSSDDTYYLVYAKRSYREGRRNTYYYTYYFGKKESDDAEIVQFQTRSNINSSDASKASPYIYYLYTRTTVTSTRYSLSVDGNVYTSDDAENVPVVLYSKGSTTTEISSREYAAWNHWRKGQDTNAGGQMIWSGLVENKLVNDQIVFTKTEGGIFDDSTAVKSIYQNVQMPFVYDAATKTYTFDSDENGVYFSEDDDQGSASVAADGARLYFNEGNTQSNGATYGDDSKNVWAPFNDATSFTEAEMDYHFGMRADIEFNMTSTGKLISNKTDSDDIVFSFSGDDDVWVFIDGQQVIDLGGIHNRLAVEINFADNTVTYSVPANNVAPYDKASTDKYYPIGNANTEASGDWTVTGEATTTSNTTQITQKLFTDNEGTGLIDQTREYFAGSTGKHTLSIFYLERGKGSSNCKISFNLPMQDTITVQKKVESCLKNVTDAGGNVTTQKVSLTDEQKAIVDNIDFTFTLQYKYDNAADGPADAYVMAANMPYFKYGSDGKYKSTGVTTADGKFTLKNGESIQIIGEMGSGVTYYVVEDDMSQKGFTTPVYTYDGTATAAVSGFAYSVGDTGYAKASDIPATSDFTSAQVHVSASAEANDTLKFVCENFVKDEGEVYVTPQDVRIVLDYGLPVQIDALANDLHGAGNTLNLEAVYGNSATVSADGSATTILSVDQTTGAVTGDGATEKLGKFGTAAIGDDNKITYTLTSQLTDVEILNYVVSATGEISSVGEASETKTVYAIGTIYIIPATLMYYEENFDGLVTFTGSGWDDYAVTKAADVSDYQEPGVVGDATDSPYGSDVAYKTDSQDSNGTSRHADTTNGAVKFSYTFTGTGTSIFARTGDNTGYMKVTVRKTDENGNIEKGLYRDTYYDSTDSKIKTLYNIPVVTFRGLDYDTYYVEVVVAQKYSYTNKTGEEVVKFHSDFYLDGIRVFGPMDTTTSESDTDATKGKGQVALLAYASDSESYMANITLREKLLGSESVIDDATVSWDSEKGYVVFTDTDGSIKTAETYKSIGPKEEVYLNEGQSVSFTLKNWDSTKNKLYLGIKAPTGSATAKIGNKEVELQNAADCYMELTTDMLDFGADGEGKTTVTVKISSVEGLVSVTNIKVTGTPDFVIDAKEISGDNDMAADDENADETDDASATEVQEG